MQPSEGENQEEGGREQGRKGGKEEWPDDGGRFISWTLEFQARLPPQPLSNYPRVQRGLYPTPPPPSSPRAAVLLFDPLHKDTWAGGVLAALEEANTAEVGGGNAAKAGVEEHAGNSQDEAAGSVPICSYKTPFPANVRETCLLTGGVIRIGVSRHNMAGWRNSIVLILNSVTVPLLFGITMQPPDNDVCGN